MALVTNLLNTQLSLKTAIGVLVAVCGVAGGAIKLTDWAEHRMTADENAVVAISDKVGVIAGDVGQITAAVKAETVAVDSLDKNVALEASEQRSWEDKVADLGKQVALLWQGSRGAPRR